MVVARLKACVFGGGNMGILCFGGLGIFSDRFSQNIPNLVVSLVILVVGWLVAVVVEILISRGLVALGFNALCEKIKFTEILKKGNIKYTPSKLASVLIYWIIVIGVILLSADALGITVVRSLLDKILAYIPNVIASILILIFGSLLSSFVGNIVETASGNTNIPHPHLLGRIVKVVIVIFAITMAIEQLGIATSIVTSTFQIVLGAIGLAFALAFGIGCKDIAKDTIEKILKEFKE